MTINDSPAMPAFFDSHCHVDGPEFDEDRADTMARARTAGVRGMIAIGAVGDIASAHRAVALAEAHPDVWATVATHPHDVADLTEAWWQTHEALARHPRVVGIGETGLDYYYEHGPRDLQRAAFERFIALARSVDKTVVCHIRDAHHDAQEILARLAQGLRVVIHCFTGTPEDARIYADAGYYVSFSGIVTYKNAEPLRAALAEVPLERLLLETDCPYLAPIPKRGRRNEPGYLVHTASAVAETIGITVEYLSKKTFANTMTAFAITGAPALDSM